QRPQRPFKSVPGVHCSGNSINFWGCSPTDASYIMTIITNKLNKPNAPISLLSTNKYPSNLIPNYGGPTAPEIVIPMAGGQKQVLKNELMKIWYIEDLMDIATRDNSGNHCIHVYALYS
uniref:Uncharacterized protein n=1 Tax=Clytia hemisphaerica TaxID=252671 RepID=A0A7M5WUZ4_9CNID